MKMMKSLDIDCALYLSPSWRATSVTSALGSVSVFVASLRASYLTLFSSLPFFSDAFEDCFQKG